jgi:hypothetical protein
VVVSGHTNRVDRGHSKIKSLTILRTKPKLKSLTKPEPKPGLGTLVEWTMGILNLVDRPFFKYTYG